jgi:hypothetical protein
MQQQRFVLQLQAGLLAAGTLATPAGLDGDLAAFLGGMICNGMQQV